MEILFLSCELLETGRSGGGMSVHEYLWGGVLFTNRTTTTVQGHYRQGQYTAAGPLQTAEENVALLSAGMLVSLTVQLQQSLAQQPEVSLKAPN